MDDRVILLAAGEMTRWQNYLNVPKHLVEIEGEPLLHRLIRQSLQHGITDILVATQHECKLPEPATRIFFDTSIKDQYSSKFLSTRASWAKNARTFLIFGDTWLSETGFNAIMTPIANGICFVGRKKNGSYTGCPHGEIFGVSFAPSHHQRIFAAAKKSDQDKGKHPSAGWALYYHLTSELAANKSTEIIFVDIDDFSEDFDFPHDYDRWQKRAGNLPYTAVPEDQNLTIFKQKQRRKKLLLAVVCFSLGIIIGQMM